MSTPGFFSLNDHKSVVKLTLLAVGCILLLTNCTVHIVLRLTSAPSFKHFYTAHSLATLMPLMIATPLLYTILRLAWRLNESRAKIKTLSRVDGLTGLYNRRYFMELANRELSLARRNKQNLSIIMIDLDHFKAVNDSFGHMGGDKVLKEFSSRLLGAIRSTDITGRYGGEEFILLLPSSGKAEAVDIAGRIQDSVNSFPVLYDHREIEFTVSIGISSLNSYPANLDQLISQADAALYLAKEKGRDRIEEAV